MKKIIVIIGLPGSGKDTIAGFLKEKGIPSYGLGDVVREEVRKRGLPITKENQEDVASDLRKKHGKDIVVRLLEEDIKKDPSETICVNGPRTIDELPHLETHGKIILIEVTASEKKRFERCRDRGNEWDPKTVEDLRHRDERNIKELGLDKVLATDKYPKYKIDNNGSLQELKEQVEEVLQQIGL